MKILLWEEKRFLVSEMNEYRNNFSRHLLNRFSELAARPIDMARFAPSVGSGRSRVSSKRVLVCHVPGPHECGQRDIVRGLYFVFIVMTCLLFPVLSRLAVAGVEGGKCGN